MASAMVVDTSVLLAILFGEQEAPGFAASLSRTRHKLTTTTSYLEACLVLAGRGVDTSAVDTLLKEAGIRRVGVNTCQAKLAVAAIPQHGKGHGKAGLKLGDLHSYALAKDLGWPLLFKGRDFIHTDLDIA